MATRWVVGLRTILLSSSQSQMKCEDGLRKAGSEASCDGLDPNPRRGNLLRRPLPAARGSNPAVQHAAEQVRLGTAEGLVRTLRSSGRSLLRQSRNALHLFATRVQAAALDTGIALVESPRRRSHPGGGLCQVVLAENWLQRSAVQSVSGRK